MWAAFFVAVIPLVWILGTRHHQGRPDAARVARGGPTRQARHHPPHGSAAAPRHAIQGTIYMALVTAAIVRADRCPDRGLPRRVRPRAAGPARLLHGRHPHRHPLDRRRPVHLRPVGLDASGCSACRFAVTLALVILMIPTVVRSTEEMLKLVPNELREASYALGRAEVEDDHEGRPPDRVLGHHHRHPARPGPGHGRDGPADHPRPVHQGHRQRPLRRPDGDAADDDQQRPRREPPARPSTGSGLPPSPSSCSSSCSTCWGGSSAASARSRPDGALAAPDNATRPRHPRNDRRHRHHGKAHRRQGPRHLLRRVQGRRGRHDDGGAALRDVVHRAVRLRQVDRAAHPEPDARGDPRRARRTAR